MEDFLKHHAIPYADNTKTKRFLENRAKSHSTNGVETQRRRDAVKKISLLRRARRESRIRLLLNKSRCSFTAQREAHGFNPGGSNIRPPPPHFILLSLFSLLRRSFSDRKILRAVNGINESQGRAQ